MGSFTWNRYKSDFVKFDEIGTTVAGTILAIEEGTDFNGKPCPMLLIETDEGTKKVTAGQKMLQAALADKEPEEGDHCVISYYANGEGKPGRAPAKLFDVKVTRAADVPNVGADDLA